MPDTNPATVRQFRRSQILDVAREIVACEGMERLTFGELERRLAFTRGVITYHFRNKDDIVHALLEDTLARIEQSAEQAVGRASDPVEAIEVVIRSMVDGFLEHRDAAYVLLSFWGRLQSDSRAAALNADLYKDYRSRCATLVRKGQERGLLRADADPDVTAAVIVGAVIGIATQVLFDEGSIDVDASVRTSGQSLAAWLAL